MVRAVGGCGRTRVNGNNNDNSNALTRRQLDQVLAPIEAATGMPNMCYTSREFFVQEREHLFSPNWACIGFASEVERPKAVKPVNFMGLPLLITRDSDSRLRVFHNVCSHRGMQLVSEPCRARGGLLVCPYHSWSYALDGELKATPHIGGVGQHSHAQFNREHHGLRQVASATWMGMVFVNLSGEAVPFEQHIEPLLSRWESFLGRDWSAQLQTADDSPDVRIDLAANWKLAVENYCEAYHLPCLHPKLNEYSKLSDHYDIMFSEAFSGQGSLAYNLSEVAGTRLPTFEQWPTQQQRHAEYVSVFPNVLLGIQADHVFAMVLDPLAPGRTVEQLRVYFIGEEAISGSFASARASIMAAWREVFGEDVDAVEGLQRGRHSPGYGGGVFSPAMDAPTHYFHKWLARAFYPASA